MTPDDDDPVDPVLASVAAYTEGAGSYAAAHASHKLDRPERFARSLTPPARILDAGCGPGRDLARFSANGHEPIGVELNPTFAELAGSSGPVVRADLRQVGSLFAPGSFDGVWAQASLVHFDEAAAGDVLAQLAVLLRPGGRLYACVRSEGETGWLEETDGRRWYTSWPPDRFADAVTAAGLVLDELDPGPYVEVWASKP